MAEERRNFNFCKHEKEQQKNGKALLTFTKKKCEQIP